MERMAYIFDDWISPLVLGGVLGGLIGLGIVYLFKVIL